jgi:Ni,Fe-hydrogenase III small subunit
MPKIWILRGIKKGIVTSRFPNAGPVPGEIPILAVPPEATGSSDWATGEKICPTDAIRASEKRIELGKCVFCQRCSNAGFVFDESDTGRSKALMAQYSGTDLQELSKKQRVFKKSFHVMMIDVGSCNACNMEVLNLSNPYYDLTRLGIFFTNSPKHADALIVVGALNKSMVDVLKRTYESLPEPKLVISAGACAISGGVFQGTESFVSPVQDVVPVDAIIPGCPPTPVQILEGLLLLTGNLAKHEEVPAKR